MGCGRQRKSNVWGEEVENESAEITERNRGELWFGKSRNGAEENANLRTKQSTKKKLLPRKQGRVTSKETVGGAVPGASALGWPLNMI